MRLWPFIILWSNCVCDESPAPPPHMLMAQRLMASLPNIPNVIQGQMEGKTDELKKMVSSVLGDGLISQLVVNPMGVAEEMGVSMDTLGINRTEVIDKLNNATNGMASAYLDGQTQQKSTAGKGSLFGDLPNLFTTQSPTSTTTVMYIDGVPIDNFDDFIRKHNPKDSHGRSIFKTSQPPPSTTPAPSAKEIAETVLEALKRNGASETTTPPTQMAVQDLGFDSRMVDPSRLGEVNHLLRRAPQRFDTLSAPSSSADVPFAPLDPPVDNALTLLRTKSIGSLSVEDVKQMQGALQQYEQTLQTKELYAKRKQLQIIQNELIEQQKKIEEEKRTQEELRKKAKELELKHKEMQLQLQQQLNNWHSAFNSHPPGMDIPPMDVPNLSSDDSLSSSIPSDDLLPPSLPTSSPSFSSSPPMPPSHSSGFMKHATFSMKPSAESSSFKIEQDVELEERRRAPERSPLSQMRYSPSQQTASEMFESEPEQNQHEEDFSSSCECIKISLDKMKGSWVQALASKEIVKKTERLLGKLLDFTRPAHLNCSRYDFTLPKSSKVAQDAKAQWEFRMENSRRSYKLTGNALTIDHQTTRIQLKDFKGKPFSMPFCVLKAGGEPLYEYMVVVNSAGPCRESSLLVRDPEVFFDKDNHELIKFLKHRISQGEMDQMDIVPYANDCR